MEFSMEDRRKAIKIALLKAGITGRELAAKHNVSDACVSQVISGKTKSKEIEKDIQEILKVWGAAI
jgi:ribosome-binding protein aMBF1 (putative translation factor)